MILTPNQSNAKLLSMFALRWNQVLGVLTCIAVLNAHVTWAAPAPDPNEQLLREVGVATDDNSLMAYLRTRTGNDADLLLLPKLIAQLGSDVFAEREAASDKLPGLKAGALSSLGIAAYSSDVETARRVQSYIRAIMDENPLGQSGAVVRLLLQRRAQGSVEVLLRYLPYADDPATAEDIWFELYQQVKDAGAIPIPLRAALKDPVPARRALAACIIGRLGTMADQQQIRQLLADAEPEVRLRAAQGLLAVKEKSAVPALISLLKEGSVGVAWQAEELLHWLAQREGPTVTLGAANEARRAQCQAAWEAWWQQCAGGLDLERPDPFLCRPILLLVSEQGAGDNDRVWLCGCDGKTRWELTHLRKPRDAQLVPTNQILVAEDLPQPNREPLPGESTLQAPVRVLTERDPEGKVRWEWRCAYPPRSIHRLPSGTTRVVCDTKVMEITPAGTQEAIREYKLDDFPRPCFQWTVNDLVLCGQVSFQKQPYLVQFTKTGVEATRTEIGPLGRNLRTAQLLSSGHYLLLTTEGNDGQLVELDEQRRIHWHYRAPFVGNALRLRDGTTLVGHGLALHGTIVEVDPWGRILWEALTAGRSPSVHQAFPLLRLGFDRPYPADYDLANSVPYRIRGLRSLDWFERYRSAWALEDLGPGAAPAVPDLLRALDDPNDLVQRRAHETLVAIGKPAVPAILRALHDERPQVRAKAATLLGTCHREPGKVAPHLVGALTWRSMTIRRRAVATLAGLPSLSDPAAVSSLADVLGKRDLPRYPEIRRCPTELTIAQGVAIILRKMGPAAKPAIPALTYAMQAPDLPVQIEAARALWSLGPEGRAAFREALESGQVRLNLDWIPVLDVLLRYVLRVAPAFPDPFPTAQETEQVVAELILALKDSNSHVRARAAGALGAIGTFALPALPALIQTLRASSRSQEPDALEIARTTAAALGSMGPAATRALPVLNEAFDRSKDGGLRSTILDALRRIGNGEEIPAPRTIP